MTIIEANTKAFQEDFLKMPKSIYVDDSNYVEPLYSDVSAVFSSSNKAYKAEDCIRFLLQKEGQYIGRIAAFVNAKTTKAEGINVGGLGFYECIDDLEASKTLFDAAIDWLKAKGIQAVDGPINLGERDKFWGCQINNFTDIPSYNQAYGRPYYSSQFEAYGFQDYFQQFVFFRDIYIPAQPIFVRKFNQVMADGSFEVRTVEGCSVEKIAKDFLTVYNKAWGDSYKNFKPMKLANAIRMVKTMKPIMDPRIIIFVFKGDEPIAFYVNIPELNEIFRKTGPNLNLWGKLKFLYYRAITKPEIMVGLIFGVVKEYQGQGMEGVMIKWVEDNILHRVPYKYTTLNWIGDFNPKMLKITERLGAKHHRKFITYRYMIDSSIPFERHPEVS
ncbi:MAG: hypothetical protein ACPGVE_00745 [Flavobacteriales bacterium]